jgi:hypothetical protein
MRGTMLVIPPDGPLRMTYFTTRIDLRSLFNEFDFGHVKGVPGFDSIMRASELHRCVAFCNEDDKNLPLNDLASAMWDAALREQPEFKNIDRSRPSLFGTVVVCFGDEEWMADV